MVLPPRAGRPRSAPWLRIVAVCVGLGSAAKAAEPAKGVDFNRDVRPILAGNCFACHGPDEGKRKAGLRLDRREDALKEADSGEPPIVPGKPDESALIDRVFAEAADRVMPPPASHKTLTAKEKETLRRWIAEGAEYREHWAFRKPQRPAPPEVADRAWPRNEIDRFVLAKLEKAGLHPSPEADRATLIRRLSLDLIGLPPTIAEIDAFLADRSPEAYEKVVDRLLASPHYGERWARRWLDRARYADTNGYEKDRERSIWPFRDWVIRALNDDMPFDRFTVEQIAGDMLPGATVSQKVASGFHRNTMINEEGGIDVEEFRFASVVDRVATTGAVWLGLTIQCAQCHTHKFDPITQREYYRFLAFFDNADEPDLALPSPEADARRAEIASKIAGLESGLEAKFPGPAAPGDWLALQPTLARSRSGTDLAIRPDGSILASGPGIDADEYTLVIDTSLTAISGLKLEALTDPTLPRNGPGRAPNGNFVLSDLRVSAAPISGPGEPIPAVIDRAEADVSQAGFEIARLIDADPSTGWAIDDGSGHLNVPRLATFGFRGAVGSPGGTRLTITLSQNYGGKHTLGAFRLSARAPTPEPTAEERRRHLAEALSAWESKITPNRWTVLRPDRLVSRKHATLTVLGDGSILATGDRPNNDTYDLELPTGLAGITALRLEVLPDPSLPEGGPGRAPLFSVGDFLLTEIDLKSGPEGDPKATREAHFSAASQDFAAPGKPASAAIDGKTDTGWSVAGGVGRAHAAVFQLKEKVGEGGRTRLFLTLHQDYIHQTTLGRFRVSATTDAGAVSASGLPAEVEEILLVPADRRTEAQSARLKRHFLSVAPELSRENAEIEALRRSEPRPTTSMVMQERPPDQARTTRIRKRGEFLQPTEAVSPGVPAALPPLPSGLPADRLTLARWLVSEENPLTARVAINQAWEAFFGRGLVATVEDFGTRGEEPSHPELLDWLATELPRSGWSLKALHRKIVTSATYRQSSRATPEVLGADPKNTLLARGPRFRVDAEVVRDLALSASGLLNPEIGGPSVYPPQPEGVTSLAYGMAAWPESAGPARHRRGLYTFAKRTAPYAGFATFDAPGPETTCVRRERSNTPLQALTLLNDVVFVEAARALAGRVLGGADRGFEGRATLAYRLALGRPPTDRELKILSTFYETQLGRFRDGSADAGAVAGIDPKAVDVADRAAWTAVARAILNLDETITRE